MYFQINFKTNHVCRDIRCLDRRELQWKVRCARKHGLVIVGLDYIPERGDRRRKKVWKKRRNKKWTTPARTHYLTRSTCIKYNNIPKMGREKFWTLKRPLLPLTERIPSCRACAPTVQRSSPLCHTSTAHSYPSRDSDTSGNCGQQTDGTKSRQKDQAQSLESRCRRSGKTASVRRATCILQVPCGLRRVGGKCVSGLREPKRKERQWNMREKR